MAFMDPFLGELAMEAPATRGMLERVPGDKLDWRPHEKSMTLGELAFHIAATPGMISELSKLDEVPPPEFGNVEQPNSVEEILAAHDESVEKAVGRLEEMTEADAMSAFRVMADDQELMSLPKVGLVRAIMLNHWYHHRGQLSVYLRLLDVPVPVTYGASADENPMAEAATNS